METKGSRWRNVRVLWSFVRPHRRTLALGLALGLGTTAASLATPMVTKSVLDGLGSSAPIGPAVALLILLLVIGSVLGLVQWILLGRLAERVVFDARSSMVGRLLRLRVSELSGRPSGELVTRVTSDTVLMREAAASSLVSFVNGTVGLVGALVLMAVLDLVLLAVTAATLVITALLFATLMPGIAKAQERVQESVGRMGGTLEGALRAIRTVKASRAERWETERVLTDARVAERESVRAVRIEAIAWTIAGGGIQLSIMLILGIGAWRVSGGFLAVSGLVAFLLYAFQLMEPISTLSSSVTSLQAGIAAAARIAQVQDLTVEEDEQDGEVRDPAAHGTSVDGAPALVLDDVVFRYDPGAKPAVNGVSLSIPRIGHTAIVGPSGAGKTTVFSLLLKFLTPQDGVLSLDGRSFAQWPIHRLRERLAYVEQDTPLVPGTLRDNLTYAAPDASEDEVWEALRVVRMDERVRALDHGLDTVLAATTISGGERQRIALARALVARPEILLLDEATAQLDGLTEATVQEGIRRLASTGAVVTIAHRLSTVIDADQIVLMDEGEVRAVGTHAELLAADELYRTLVAALRIAVPDDAVLDASGAPVG